MMKYILLLLLLLIGTDYGADAQTVTQYKHGSLTIKLSTRTVVTDTAGTQYPFTEWQKLISSGDYILKPTNPQISNTPFVIYKIDKSQRDAILSAMPRPDNCKNIKVGAKPYLINMEDIEGKKIVWSELEGKVVVVDFWDFKSHTTDQIIALNKLSRDYPDVVFIGITTNQKKDVLNFLKNTPFNFRISSEGVYNTLFNGVASTLPAFVVLDKKGLVYFATCGFALNTVFWIRKTIDEANKTP